MNNRRNESPWPWLPFGLSRSAITSDSLFSSGSIRSNTLNRVACFRSSWRCCSSAFSTCCQTSLKNWCNSDGLTAVELSLQADRSKELFQLRLQYLWCVAHLHALPDHVDPQGMVRRPVFTRNPAPPATAAPRMVPKLFRESENFLPRGSAWRECHPLSFGRQTR